MGKNGDMFAKVIALASLLVSIVGLGSIWISIQSFKQSERAALASTSQQIISDSADVDKLFIQYPEMRAYIPAGVQGGQLEQRGSFLFPRQSHHV